jgi:hypothetical protein
MTYRVVHYKNGLYEDIYRVQAWRWWFPFWIRVTVYVGYECFAILEFNTRVEAQDWIASTERYDLQAKRRVVLTKIKEER